jgi:hypothetical protein
VIGADVAIQNIVQHAGEIAGVGRTPATASGAEKFKGIVIFYKNIFLTI